MIDNTIWVAIVSGLCVGVPSVISTVMLNNKNQAIINAKMEKNHEFVNYQIQELTKQVEKHNSVVERMTIQEQSTKALWHNVDEIKERLDRG